MAGCLPPATLQVVHVRFWGSSPRVQVPLPCSELASDQSARNWSCKSWRHPSAWSFRTGCPDWTFSIIYQCILLRCIKEYTESWCFQIEQISSVLFEHLHLVPVCHAYTSCETHALPFCILLRFIKGFWWRHVYFGREVFKYKMEILQFGVENVSLSKRRNYHPYNCYLYQPIKEQSKYLSKVSLINCDLFLYDK